MILDKDLKGVLKMKWQHHAGRNIPFSISWIHLEGYIKTYPRFIGLRFKSVIVEGRKTNLIMWRDAHDVSNLRFELKKKIKDKNFIKSSFQKIKDSFKKYKEIGKFLKKLKAQELLEKELIKSLDIYYKSFQVAGAAVSTLIELISSYSQKIAEKISKHKEDTLTYIASPLYETTPLKEEKEFLTLIRKLKSRSYKSKKKVLINKHFVKYYWLPVYLVAKPWLRKDFRQRVKLALLNINPLEELRKLKINHQENERKIKVFMTKNKLNKKNIRLLREMIYYRIEFENLFSYVGNHSYNLIRKIVGKLNLKFDDFFYLKHEEVKKALMGKEKMVLKSLINARKKHYVIVTGKTKRHEFTGNGADLFLKKLKIIKPKKIKYTKSLKGLCGSQGKVNGKIRIISVDEIPKFKTGEILVTQNTTPTFLPAIKKAAAIVTDEGGITCHAAIVSRELGIPCVIGTKIATKVFKYGDKVEVDATKGIVRKL